jgi:hypothetical protein
MKRLLIGVLAASALATALPAAAAWRSVNMRQADIYRKIDLGVRNGALTRNEAIAIRSQFNNIARLEATYRRSGGGLSLQEQRDLDLRLRNLNMRVRTQKHDAQHR